MKKTYLNSKFVSVAFISFFVLLQFQLFAQFMDEITVEGQLGHSIIYEEYESPVFYNAFRALNSSEIHLFDTLSKAERDFIESQFEPQAIGVYRKLPAPVNFDLNKTLLPSVGDEFTIFGGRLTRIDEETIVWTTRFTSKGADEIRLHFTEGYFPHGVRVNLFSPEGGALFQYQLRGLVGEYGFYTTTTFSETVTLQVVIPIDVIAEPLFFTIEGFTHVESKYIEDFMRSCIVDAMCITSSGFTHINNLRLSAAQLTFVKPGGTFICSGGLLNDQRPQDLQPFFLTAAHCFNTQASAASLEARFDFRTTSCNGSNNPNVILINGSNLIATNSQSDFTLVLLHAKPATPRWYLGWTTAAPSNLSTLHSVHHPGGQRQRYTRLTLYTNPSHTCASRPTTHYHYSRNTMGESFGGSSGAPVVNANNIVIGQNWGRCFQTGNDNCNYSTYHVVWGKWSSSYSNNNLQFWLGSSPGAQVTMSTTPSSTMNFGTRNVGSNTDFNVNVTNTGTVPNFLNLEAGTVSISGTNASQFSIVGNTSLYLAPGQSGTFTVRFSPTSNGFKTATLNIPHNADNISSPRQITLNGHGNPCSDFVDLNNGGVTNNGFFSRSGTGSWNTSSASACGFTCPGRERVFKFTAPYSGNYRIHVTSTNGIWVNYMYRTGSCSSTGWTCISDVLNPGIYGSFFLSAGTDCYILLDSESTSLTTHNFYVGMPGRWEGVINNDWETANNWYDGIVPDQNTDVTIFSGKPNNPVITNGTAAICRNLVLTSGATLTQQPTSWFYVYGTFDPAPGLFTMSGSTFLYFAGTSSNSWWNDGVPDVYTNVRVDKSNPAAITTMRNNTTLSGNFQMWNGTFAMTSSRTLTVNATGTAAFRVDNGSTLNLGPDRTIDVAGQVRFRTGCQTNVTGGTIMCGGNFLAESNSGNIDLTNATLIMHGSGTQSIQDSDGNTIHHLIIDKPSGVASIAGTNLGISGNLTIDSGTFSLATFSCEVGGTTNINNGGTLRMHDSSNDLTSAGIFWNAGSTAEVTAGTFHADIWGFYAGCNAMIGTGNTTYIPNMYFPTEPTAHFGDLVVVPFGTMLSDESRSTVPVNVAGNLTIIDGAAWTFPGPSGMIVTGNSTIESGGTLTLNSSAVFNTGGALQLSGTLNLNSGSSALVNSNFTFPSTGTLSINNGSFINDQPDTGAWTLLNGTFSLSSGLFELTNNHPNFNSAVATTVSGGIIRTGGAFSASASGVFEPTGGVVDITGNNSNGAVYCYNGNYFHNLVVNRGASWYSQFMLGHPVSIQNNLTVNSGTINSGSSEISVYGNVLVNNDSKFEINGAGSLLLDASRSVTVNNGGILELNGNIDNQPKISRISTGNYAFNIESGGTIGAVYALFEHMNTNGVNLKPGAMVDPAKAFHHSTFRNGQSGGRLMTLNNSQTFSVNYANFPNNTWGGNFNVFKTEDAGVVTFMGYGGIFSGEANEWDPHNRVHWGGETAANVSLQGVDIAPGQEICFEATNTLTLGGSGSSFAVQGGGYVELVAGQRIRLLEGVHFHNGSYGLMRITTSGDYCGLPAPLMAVAEEKLAAVEEVIETKMQDKFFKVYPNPTTGMFNLELSEIASTFTVEIYGLMGEQILRQEVSGYQLYEFDLSHQPRGVYIIRVLYGGEIGIERVIRQ